jgi:hypothetical protein
MNKFASIYIDSFKKHAETYDAYGNVVSQGPGALEVTKNLVKATPSIAGTLARGLFIDPITNTVKDSGRALEALGQGRVWDAAKATGSTVGNAALGLMNYATLGVPALGALRFGGKGLGLLGKAIKPLPIIGRPIGAATQAAGHVTEGVLGKLHQGLFGVDKAKLMSAPKSNWWGGGLTRDALGRPVMENVATPTGLFSRAAMRARQMPANTANEQAGRFISRYAMDDLPLAASIPTSIGANVLISSIRGNAEEAANQAAATQRAARPYYDDSSVGGPGAGSFQL